MPLLLITSLILVKGLTVVYCNENDAGCKATEESNYSDLLKLIRLEEKLHKHETIIQEQGKQIESLKNRTEEDGATYIRWGRTTCPSGATVVYTGYKAGSYYLHTGGASNPLCLTSKPTWEKFTGKGEKYGAFIYGAEYATYEYSMWYYLQNNDVPCIVCRVPSNDVLMVPGTKICPRPYSLQYKGYLMAGHYSHAAPSEFICVDGDPETINRSYEDKEGYLLYFVQAICGSLSCGPYIENREVTCAVCSFSL
ncbi:uncharacterized protein LOC132756488 [Ruditapes philippinarum]|uniref:uncharacterized protein LOC132756488 n=1 Tax=Ruditapes philippinarum TaxID=129788 RepID=UPI00295A6B66|nr:uncharacterized protein LOC132756488 [Ruditapes philippinarum]